MNKKRAILPLLLFIPLVFTIVSCQPPSTDEAVNVEIPTDKSDKSLS